MKTTEVFVEQVLIGLLVILNLGLILCPDIAAKAEHPDITSSVAVIATAYLVGIVFDRFADTLLEDIERYSRLKLALKGKKLLLDNDPFPEDQYRMKVFQNREASSYTNYLRSRIRLSRAMAILIPGLSVSFLLSKTRESMDRSWWIAAAVSVGLIYSGALVAQLIRGKKNESKDESGKKKKTAIVWYKVPKTNELKDHMENWHDGSETNAPSELENYIKDNLPLSRLAVGEPFSWATALLIGLGFALASQTSQSALFAVPVLSIALTLLTVWTWCRINKTFLVFLRDYFEHNKKEKARTGW